MGLVCTFGFICTISDVHNTGLVHIIDHYVPYLDQGPYPNTPRSHHNTNPRSYNTATILNVSTTSEDKGTTLSNKPHHDE